MFSAVPMTTDQTFSPLWFHQTLPEVSPHSARSTDRSPPIPLHLWSLVLPIFPIIRQDSESGQFRPYFPYTRALAHEMPVHHYLSEAEDLWFPVLFPDFRNMPSDLITDLPRIARFRMTYQMQKYHSPPINLSDIPRKQNRAPDLHPFVFDSLKFGSWNFLSMPG